LNFFFPNLVCLCTPKTRNVQEFFFPIPTILFIVKKLYLLPFSTRLQFLNIFLITSHIEILKIRKCNKYANLLLYKILVYWILRFVSPYWKFAIESLKRIHCVLLVLEGIRPWFCKNSNYSFVIDKIFLQIIIWKITIILISITIIERQNHNNDYILHIKLSNFDYLYLYLKTIHPTFIHFHMFFF